MPPADDHVVAPVVVHLSQDLELLGEIHLLALRLGAGLGRALRALGDVVPVRVGLAVVLGLLLLAHPLHGELLERGVRLKLLLDHGAQVKGGHLEDLQRLAQLRRQDKRLRLALAKILAETSRAHRL